MRDFWLSSGHHLLDRDEGGGFLVSDGFLKMYFTRPELTPPPGACAVERTLHSELLADPRQPVAAADIAAISDSDARENWNLMIAFRDHLLSYHTLEAGYVALLRAGSGETPSVFLDQLVQVILRNALDGCEDPLVLRAGEMFFRPQLLTTHEGALLAADEDRIKRLAVPPPSSLTSMLKLPAPVAIDLLGEDDVDQYFARSDRFDMAFDLSPGGAGLAALGTVTAAWIKHVLATDVIVETLQPSPDIHLNWYVGLDAEGTKIGDRLWHGDALDEPMRRRMIGVYRLTFAHPETPEAEDPVHLILGMTPERIVRMTPQNLVTGLPAHAPSGR